jgi:hypothetical protein
MSGRAVPSCEGGRGRIVPLAMAAGIALSACGGSGAPAATSVPVGGTVSGLAGSGLLLRSSLGDELPVESNGPFAFRTAAPHGHSVAVSVAAPPVMPWQSCSVEGSPTVASTAVRVTVTCSTRSLAVGGRVSGLVGTGLVLRGTFGDAPPVDLEVGADGAFAFPGTVPSGTAYAVAVRTQPTASFCSVASGIGTVAGSDVTDVAVACSPNAYRITGAVHGLVGSGLVLRNGGRDDLPVPPGATTFAFAEPVASGGRYDVSVAAQPSRPTQLCAVESGGGSVGVADVDGVTVTCVTRRFRVGGTVVGLRGSGLVLSMPGQPDLAVPAGADTFAFEVPVASGATYSVRVVSQPTGPTQACAVGAGDGEVGGGDVTSVVVNCSTSAFLLGGTVSGLTGTGLALASPGLPTLQVPAGAASFTFGNLVASGTAYDVSVTAQPTSPWQTCAVVGGTGSVAGSSVTGILVPCTTNRYALRGTVRGLAGQGLVLSSPGLASRSVASGSAAFAFDGLVESGRPYAVTVAAQPTAPAQTCTVDGGTGVVGGADVERPVVTCTTNRYAVRGTVSGLQGGGLVLAAEGLPDLAVPSPSTTWAFGGSLESGTAYAVRVAAQPTGPSQTCAVTGGTGTVAAADVAATVTCTTDRFALGGTVSGLSGSGLTLSSSGLPNLSVAAGATSFTFATRLESGGAYAVAVAAQPTGPSQTCSVTRGSGTVGAADVGNVAVTCTTNTYRIRGTVSGLAGSGLVLLDNGGDALHVAADGSFAFSTPVASGARYAVTVGIQPAGPSQTCTVTGGSGTVAAADVSGVTVTCVTNRFLVRPTVTGLAGSGLVLRNNGGDPLDVWWNGTFSFATALLPGSPYAVTVATQPTSPWQTCTVTGGTGTVGDADVSGVAVGCATNTYRIGGTVTGLTGSGLVLRDNGGDALTVSANGAFTFPTRVASGSTYAVTVRTQPAGQVCSVSSGSGTVAGSDVGGVTVFCGDPPTVTVSPSGVDLGGGGTYRFHATVTNLPDTSVTWSVEEGLRGGAIDASGLYTAPAGGGTFHVVASSAMDAAWSGSATVTVTSNGAAAMPVVSRGVPAFASAGNASLANDGDYGSQWNATGSAWLAYDLAGAGPLGMALVAWYNNEAGTYDISYGGGADGIPGTYAVEVHADDGSGSPPSSGWVTVASVTGNTLSGRFHTVDLTGQRWIRLNGSPAGSAFKINMDVHDARGGFTDTWAFVGDSNTARYMTHAPLAGQNLAERVQGSGLPNFPAYLNCGVPGLYAIGDGLPLVQRVLAEFPQVRFVAITLGGNDSANGLPSNYAFYDAYRAMVDSVLAAGRVPVVPRTVIWHGQPTAYRAISDPSPYSLDNQLARLITDYTGRVVVGPDLWTVFDTAPKNGSGQPLDASGHALIEGDLVHAANPYGMTLSRDLWADAILSVY